MKDFDRFKLAEARFGLSETQSGCCTSYDQVIAPHYRAGLAFGRMATPLLKPAPDVKETRDEIAGLIAQSEDGIRKSQEILRKLRKLQLRVNRLDKRAQGLKPRVKSPK